MTIRLSLRARMVLLTILVAGAVGCGQRTPASDTGADGRESTLIGGDFRLIDTAGRRVDQTLLKGKWSAVFFGYSSCPDVCPTTLTLLTQSLSALGSASQQVQVVFITIDPVRDTPTRLKRYLSNESFPKGVIGLTGSASDIAAVARAYRVYYKKVSDGPSYSMDHTAVIYLMSPRGVFSRPISPSASPTDVAGQIKKAMEQG